jgi:GAF domain-containing protein
MTLPEQAAHELAELSALLVADDLHEALGRVARVAARVVEPCDSASITLWRDGAPATAASSSPEAQALDELQYRELEGPCVSCVREGTVLRVVDLREESRWPYYVRAAVGSGLRSSAALPLSAHGQVVGALNLYAAAPAAFRAQDVALGGMLASHAAVAVHGASLYYATRDLAGQLREAMASRAVIEQAKGVLMAREGLDAEAAFELLRRSSQHANRKLRDVAAELVASTSRQQGQGAGLPQEQQTG